MVNKHLNLDRLKLLFKEAKPFPYVVVDNFFDSIFFEKLSSSLEEYYDDNKNKGGVKFSSEVEDGKWGSSGLVLSEELVTLGKFLQSTELRGMLESITGFKNLKITSDLNSSGYSFFHAMSSNSFLGPHTDHTVDMNGKSYHVLNIIIYASKEWDANFGGGTTIHDKKGKIFTDVEFKPNRALIFLHSPISIHGTQRISNYADKKRFSIYFDFYSDEVNPYIHLDLPTFSKISSPHLFYFDNVFDYFKPRNRKYLGLWKSHYKAKFLNIFKSNS
jgi:hypothetical protein